MLFKEAFANKAGLLETRRKREREEKRKRRENKERVKYIY